MHANPRVVARVSSVLLLQKNQLNRLSPLRCLRTTAADRFLFRTSRHIKTHNYFNDHHVVNGVYTEAGSLQPVPKWYRFGITKVMICVTAFILLGSFVSQSAAEFLEDNEIFVPDDDDD